MSWSTRSRATKPWAFATWADGGPEEVRRPSTRLTIQGTSKQRLKATSTSKQRLTVRGS